MITKSATRSNFDQKLTTVNQKLKAERCRVTIQRDGVMLSLRGTLPPKPGSGKVNPVQARIALGVSATPEGLRLAIDQAKLVSAKLNAKEFSWEPYLKPVEPEPPPLSALPVGELIQELEADYFTNRERTTSKLHTWKIEYQQPLGKLPQDRPLNRADCLELLRSTRPNSRSRLRYATALGVLAKFALNLTIADEILALRGNWRGTHHEIKDLPSEAAIVEAWAKIPNPEWRWAYGMMAVYGIRPHEIWHLDTTELQAGGIVLKVLGQTKTGRREVWPCPEAWIELFGLRDVRIPPDSKAGSGNAAIGHRVAVQFGRYGLGFNPYCLRHGYAVRLVQLVPDTIAAKWMGHDVNTHTGIYQDFIGRANYEEVYRRAMAKG